MSKIDQTVTMPYGLESHRPSTIFGALQVVVWAAVAVVLVASLFANAERTYIAQSVPTLATPYADSGLALLRGLPLP